MHGNSGKVLMMTGGLMLAALSYAAAAANARPLLGGLAGAATFQADSVTGCLQKGADKNTFSLTSKDGKKYDVTSKTVPLHNHVGHTVTITGAAGKAPNSLDATAIKHVSPTCS